METQDRGQIEGAAKVRVELASSNLRDIEYDPMTQDLIVCFQSLAAYQYTGVPPEIVQGLCEAESKGAYFHQYLRNAFPCKKLPAYVPFDGEAARLRRPEGAAQEASE